MYTLTAVVPRVTLKGTLHIVAIFGVLCETFYLLLKILSQDWGEGVIEGVVLGWRTMISWFDSPLRKLQCLKLPETSYCVDLPRAL